MIKKTAKTNNTKYYISYGSNMSEEMMRVRAPDAKIAGTGILHGWRLLFRYYATITENKDFDTPVLVWKISEADERRLDFVEGFPRTYFKRDLSLAVISPEGRDLGELTAIVYIMTNRGIMHQASPLPSRDYFSIINKSYETWKFNKQPLADALMEARS